MKGYILTVAGAILISAIAAILTPGGKLGAFIKGMTRLFVFSVVVAPLAGLFGKHDFTFSSVEITIDESYLHTCAERLSLQCSDEIEAYLFEKYALTAEAEVERGIEDGFPIEKITVNIYGEGIFGQEEHIDIADKIRAELMEKYDCRAEVAWSG